MFPAAVNATETNWNAIIARVVSFLTLFYQHRQIYLPQVHHRMGKIVSIGRQAETVDRHLPSTSKLC